MYTQGEMSMVNFISLIISVYMTLAIAGYGRVDFSDLRIDNDDLASRVSEISEAYSFDRFNSNKSDTNLPVVSQPSDEEYPILPEAPVVVDINEDIGYGKKITKSDNIATYSSMIERTIGSVASQYRNLGIFLTTKEFQDSFSNYSDNIRPIIGRSKDFDQVVVDNTDKGLAIVSSSADKMRHLEIQARTTGQQYVSYTSSITGGAPELGAYNKWVGELANYSGIKVSAGSLQAMQNICVARCGSSGSYCVLVQEPSGAVLFGLEVSAYGTPSEMWTIGSTLRVE